MGLLDKDNMSHPYSSVCTCINCRRKRNVNRGGDDNKNYFGVDSPIVVSKSEIKSENEENYKVDDEKSGSGRVLLTTLFIPVHNTFVRGMLSLLIAQLIVSITITLIVTFTIDYPLIMWIFILGICIGDFIIAWDIIRNR